MFLKIYVCVNNSPFKLQKQIYHNTIEPNGQGYKYAATGTLCMYVGVHNLKIFFFFLTPYFPTGRCFNSIVELVQYYASMSKTAVMQLSRYVNRP